MSWDDPTNDKHDVAFDTSLADRETWMAEEIDQLRMDVEDMEIEVLSNKNRATHAIENANRARNEAREAKRRMTRHRAMVAAEFADSNKEISDKCMVYLDLIKEYEDMTMHQARYSGIAPTNNNIIRLRKQGGLDK